MKVYVVHCIHAGYPDYADTDWYNGHLCGSYSNLALAARAAIKAIETDFYTPSRIRYIFYYNDTTVYTCYNENIINKKVYYYIETVELNKDIYF